MSFNVQLPDDAGARANILEAGKRMFDKGYCAANDGNISCRTKDGFFWVTPSGFSKGFMTENDLVKVDADGTILEQNADVKISSEIKLHMNVYRHRPDMNAVVHAHPPLSTAFACARMDMNAPVVTEALLNLGEVPCAPFAAPGTPELAETIVPYLNGHACCLMASHGALSWGTSMEQAYFRLETMEYYAKILMLTGIRPEPAHLLEGQEMEATLKQRERYKIKF
ncbi:MAG: class II aldolase/adducin family protein [Firmicutes bacterium]|nr:class II aldolase/adducin family protein [Bacillota bacterium]